MTIRPALFRLCSIPALLLLINFNPLPTTENLNARADYVGVTAELQRVIQHEMADKLLPALSIALVDGQEIVWAQGFGFADPEQKIPATAATVYRVGSLSKLFTDLGIMQLVESGALQLDAPITKFLPEFQPKNPFGKTITLRQLMSHRAGLVREPPIGNYFDDTQPTLPATVKSLNNTALVYAPETRIKYSNAGIATVGYVLEQLRREPFADYLKRTVLLPMGLQHSSFVPEAEINKKLAKAYMWGYDNRQFVAPDLQLGMAPAANMYSTVADLGQFMKVLFNRGKNGDKQILKPETLELMWTPQFAQLGQKQGFGIGFAIGEIEGRRSIGHGGAMYGFATQISALPDEKLGVIAITSMDCANIVVERIAEHALKLMLAKREQRALPKMKLTAPVDSMRARQLEGKFVSGDASLELVERNGQLLMWLGSICTPLRSLGDTLIADGRITYGTKLLPRGRDSLLVGERVFLRVAPHKPASAPDRWSGLIGEYGWDHNVLFIHERNGTLHALIEWFFSYPLQEMAADTFAFPNYGLYHGEKLIFTRAANGRATQVEAASVVFKRREVGAEAGNTFRIDPIRPIAALRALALAGQPPPEQGNFRSPDLVDLAELDSSIKFDIRYATTNNFMGEVFYEQAKTMLQQPAAAALLRAHQSLREMGYGLLIHDAYRPWSVTKMFWEATPQDMKIFVADPSQGSRHNRGCAVDLTLYDLKTGKPVEMVSGYDEFSERAYPDYPGGSSEQRWLRELLRDAMEAQGFKVYEFEWWHFDYKDWRKYPIQNIPFVVAPSGAQN
ncbi:serine hydrolase [bacterium]|nr:serine hydrolase [bacterium]